MFVVIFRSKRSVDHSEMYQKWAEKMEQLVVAQSGYISHFSIRDEDTGEGVTVSCFDSQDAIKQWHDNSEHVEAQTLGRSHFYESFSVEVAEVARRYDWQN